MSWEAGVAVGLLVGFTFGAGLVILLTHRKPECDHQYNTVFSDCRDSSGRLYWVDECHKCLHVRARRQQV